MLVTVGIRQSLLGVLHNLLGGGDALASAPHQYWRVLGIEPGDQSSVNYAALLFGFEGAVVPTTGGSAISSSGAATRDNAFDGNPATKWQSATNDVAGAWIGYAFGTPVRVDSFTLQAANSFQNRAWYSAALQWSDDGVTWKTLFAGWDMVPSTANQLIERTAPPGPGAGNVFARYYRASWQTGSGNNAVELEILTQLGVDVVSSNLATASATSEFSSAYPVRDAFDGNPGSAWYTQNNHAPGSLTLDFGNLAPASTWSQQVDATYGADYVPGELVLEASNDGVLWDPVYSEDPFTAFVDGETRDIPLMYELPIDDAQMTDPAFWTQEAGTAPLASSLLSAAHLVVGDGQNPSYSQVIDLPVTDRPLIDAGHRQIEITVGMASSSGDDDANSMEIEALGAGGDRLSRDALPMFEPPDNVFTDFSLLSQLPVGTRKVRVRFRGERDSGTECSAYQSNLRYSYSNTGTPRLLIGTWDPSSTTGVVSASNLSVAQTAIWGESYLSADTNVAEFYRSYPVSIDLTGMVVELRANIARFDAGHADTGRLALVFRDGNGSELSRDYTEPSAVAPPDIHTTTVRMTAIPPAGTARIDLLVEANKVGGGVNADYPLLDAVIEAIEAQGSTIRATALNMELLWVQPPTSSLRWSSAELVYAMAAPDSGSEFRITAANLEVVRQA